MNRCSAFLIFCLVCISASNFSQTASDSINHILIRNTLAYADYKAAPARKILQTPAAHSFARYNPVHYLAAGLLFFYQRVLSEQIQANCNYVISCSEYTKQAIYRRGFLIGILIGANQLNNCVPGITTDYPSFRLNPESKIINSAEDE
jgi:putative component of membrane protein insertase Oxa1/YidC/SpoIIIJ protein YidD